MSKAMKLFLAGFGAFAVFLTVGFGVNADAKLTVITAFYASICFTIMFSLICKKELEEEDE